MHVQPHTWTRAQIRERVRLGMSMKGFEFTKANINELKPAEREYLVWSADAPGFGVRVSPTGKKAWIVQFRTHDGRARRRTLGDLRVVAMTIAEKRATEVLAHAKLYGRDLIEEERDAASARRRRAETSIGSIAAAYLAEPETRAKRSFPEIERYLKTVWAEAHHLDAETVDRHPLIPILRRIASARGETTANRAKASLSAMFVWAIRHGQLRRDTNPCTFLPAWAEQKRERALPLEELGQIWQAAPQVNPQFGRMVRLLILTGCRKSEISDLDWSEVDLGRSVLSLPGSRTKNGLPLLVPLAPAAAAVLAGTPRLSDHRVFVGFRAWGWGKSRLDMMIGIPSWRIHDLRRSAATGWREHLQADSHVCELALNHVSGSRGGVAGTYDRSERLKDRQKLLERWAALVLEAAGEPAPAAAKLVSIQRGSR
jgi:integrase